MRTGLGRLLSIAMLCAGVVPATAVAADGPPFSVRTLHFDVVAGPDDDTHCDVVGDLYTPAGASAADPAPAVLTTNGFGGSKDDQQPIAEALAERGYVVLSYSGLGFGGSGCKIELDDPDWDGKAGSQLVSFLGGTKAATDGTTLDDVQLDGPGDPRIGMLGGSYGGQIQYAVAEQDPRVDTIVPIITWNDLAYSLTPNNTDLTGGAGSVTSSTPGVAKYDWALGFTALGIADGVENLQVDPSRVLTTCPNFDDRVCPGVVEAAVSGEPSPETLALLRHASVSTYIKKIKIPTLLLQGEKDTLFNLNESIATYQALRRQGTPVKLVWQSWGHSDSTAAPGELGEGPSPTMPDGSPTYEGTLLEQWFDHYLKDAGPQPALDFSYFRDWVSYSGDATPAFGVAPAYPAGTDRKWLLSSTDALATTRRDVSAGSARFVTPPLGGPTSMTEISAVSQDVPLFDAPGTYARYTSAPLLADTDVVGPPRVRIKVSSLGLKPPTLFLKVQDVAPDGTVTLPGRLVAPIRPASLIAPLEVTLPAFVHRFAAGHRIRLVVAGSDAAYRGAPGPAAVTIATSQTDPGTLTLPVVG